MQAVEELLAQGRRHQQAGDLPTAERSYREVVRVDGRHPDGWYGLGSVCFQLGKVDEAIECLRRVLELRPDNAAVHGNLGIAMATRGRAEEAVGCFEAALRLDPSNVVIRGNLGNALRQAGRLEAAEACLRDVLDRQPSSGAAHVNLGLTLLARGRIGPAIDWLRQAVRLSPGDPQAHHALGSALLEQGIAAEAAVCFARACDLRPDFAESESCLGMALKESGRLDEALAHCLRAVRLEPDGPEGHNNLGIVLAELGRWEDAAASYQRAVELRPEFAEARYNLSMNRLLMGDFERGWTEYEWRWKTRMFADLRRTFSRPAWDGSPLPGGTILLCSEQGFGDSIQFVRYASLVKRRVGTVVLECPRALASLLGRCPGIDRVVAEGDPRPDFDVHATLLTLPRIFRTELETIPGVVPYLTAEPGLVARWKREIDALAGIKIGIAWHGNPHFKGAHRKSIPLARLAGLARLEGVHLVSLQKGAGREQLAAFAAGAPITDLGDRLRDFMDTAAVMTSLDLIVTIDTASAHLAGALGRPVWVALPFPPDWRWLLDRSDTPWYPTMRLFRQRRLGDWDLVVAEIARELERLDRRA